MLQRARRVTGRCPEVRVFVRMISCKIHGVPCGGGVWVVRALSVLCRWFVVIGRFWLAAKLRSRWSEDDILQRAGIVNGALPRSSRFRQSHISCKTHGAPHWTGLRFARAVRF